MITVFICSIIKQLILLSIGFFITTGLQATPLNNVFDTQPIHTVHGADKFFTEKEKGEIRFDLSPIYQQTSTARDSSGIKVPIGNRLGQWNLLGLFYGTEAANNIFVNYKNLSSARNSISTTTKQIQVGSPDNSRYRNDGDLTNETNFKPLSDTFAFMSVPVTYEKIGLRSQITFDFGFGLGVTVKGGIIDVKQTPKPFILESTLLSDTGLGPTPTTQPSANQIADAKAIYNALFEQNRLHGITNDLNYSLEPYHKTSPEDIHLQFYWNFPVALHDKEDDIAVTLIPRISIGMWLPSGDQYDYTKAFSVSTGNDGYYGFTAEGSLGFDFPIIPKGQTLQFNLGGGFLVANEREQSSQPIYSSKNQSGIIPWKTSISKQPGLTWYMNASMMTEGMIDRMGFFFDFIYTQHLEDSIILRTTEPNRLAAFKNGIDVSKRESAWRNQQVNMGLNYKVTDSLVLGGAVQGHISGVRVYRSVTLLGGITLSF